MKLAYCILALTLSASAQEAATSVQKVVPLTQKQIDALADAQRKLDEAWKVYRQERANLDATKQAVFDQLNLPLDTRATQEQCSCSYEYAIVDGKYVVVQRNYGIYVSRSK